MKYLLGAQFLALPSIACYRWHSKRLAPLTWNILFCSACAAMLFGMPQLSMVLVMCRQVDELDYAIRKKDPSKANILLADVQKSLDTAIAGIAA